MTVPTRNLAHPPIVEAVVDFDCVMPPAFDVQRVEAAARAALGDRYPKLRTAFIAHGSMEIKPGGKPNVSAEQGVHALQLLQADGRQLVQVRARGFSFNRLDPYTGFDDYLPEIQRTWRIFVELVSPVSVRAIGLRYINRFSVPIDDNRIDIAKYLRIAPKFPVEERLAFTGFLSQQAGLEQGTANEVKMVLASQPIEGSALPVILDIEVTWRHDVAPADWETLLTHFQSLRELKNSVFMSSLTEDAVRLFQ